MNLDNLHLKMYSSNKTASPSVSVVFPAFNDSYVVVDQVKQIERYLLDVGRDFEIIVVNDGSRDDTGPRLAEAMAHVPSLKVVTHPHNRGYGAAILSGFAVASKELVLYTDGDGQYDVRESHRLFERLIILRGKKGG
jgi:glycosyltransferase involved in cell wall biosynthesis